MASLGGEATTILDAASAVPRDGFWMAGVIRGPQDNAEVMQSIDLTRENGLVASICKLHHLCQWGYQAGLCIGSMILWSFPLLGIGLIMCDWYDIFTT